MAELPWSVIVFCMESRRYGLILWGLRPLDWTPNVDAVGCRPFAGRVRTGDQPPASSLVEGGNEATGLQEDLKSLLRRYRPQQHQDLLCSGASFSSMGQSPNGNDVFEGGCEVVDDAA
jgi:hypothetical protein